MLPPYDPAMPKRFGNLRTALVALLLTSLGSGCVAVRFNELEGHRKRVMTGETQHALKSELRGHVLSPREGAVGGFSNVGAGGCGCH